MASSLITLPMCFEFNSYITGHYVYKDIWKPNIGDLLSSWREKDNPHDEYVVCIMKESLIVGHVPRDLSKSVSYLLLCGTKIVITVAGKYESKRNNSLEVPAKYEVRGPKYHVERAKIFIYDYFERMRK